MSAYSILANTERAGSGARRARSLCLISEERFRSNFVSHIVQNAVLLSLLQRHCSHLSRRRWRTDLPHEKFQKRAAKTKQNKTLKNKIKINQTRETIRLVSVPQRSVHFSISHVSDDFCSKVAPSWNSRSGSDDSQNFGGVSGLRLPLPGSMPVRAVRHQRGREGREASEPSVHRGGSFRRGGKLRKKERERKKISLFQERGDDRTFSFVALIQQPV